MMPCAEASGRSVREVGGHLWRPAGAVYLLVSLGGLAAGLFPEAILPAHVSVRSLPVLAALASAQAGFILLFGPAIIGRRRDLAVPTYVGMVRLAGAAEILSWVAAGAPFYLAAAWFSDATFPDVARSLMYLAGVAVAAWGLGAWAGAGRFGAAVATLVALSAGLGLPALGYLLAEFANAGPWAGLLWSAGPITAAFSVAARPSGPWLPSPLWAWLLWPTAGVILALGRLLIPRPDAERTTS